MKGTQLPVNYWLKSNQPLNSEDRLILPLAYDSVCADIIKVLRYLLTVDVTKGVITFYNIRT